jgi:uncharacterized protein
MTELEEFRRLKDGYFREDPQSPLTEEQRRDFRGLEYFPENRSLRFELPLEKYEQPAAVKMETSTGSDQDYIKIGRVTFAIHGEEATLEVFESVEDPGAYFVPFVDATAPDETYGAGRYLEPVEIGENKLLVDFNLAYNPYCAYNERWSCPLPPSGNRLRVRIDAGEKKFH